MSTANVSTSMCDSVVIHVRVRSRPQFDFGWPGSPRGDGWGRCGKGGAQRKTSRETLPLVFLGTKLSVQFLQLSVLLGLKRHHFFDVPECPKHSQCVVLSSDIKRCHISITIIGTCFFFFLMLIFCLHLYGNK